MQKGNTLFLLRDIMANPANPGATPQPQFVGLASKFDLLDVNLRWDTRVFDGLGLRLNGNYIRNLAYSKGRSGAARRVIWSTTSTRTAKCRAVRTPGCCRPRWAVRST